jgi:hypothetical protein
VADQHGRTGGDVMRGVEEGSEGYHVGPGGRGGYREQRTAGEYRVRFGLRGVAAHGLWFVVWVAVWPFLLARQPQRAAGLWIGWLLGAALLAVALNALRRAVRRETVLLVNQKGVLLGGEGGGLVCYPWGQVHAVELFTETVNYARSQTRYRCVGLRSWTGERPGRTTSGPDGMPERSARYLRDAGRPDLLSGADGTRRVAYRRMEGWRVNRRALETAVRRFAPGVPVVDGPPWPPTITAAEARAVARTRRERRSRG